MEIFEKGHCVALCDPWSIGKAIQSLQEDLTIVMLFQHSAVSATPFLHEGGYMCVLMSIAVDFSGGPVSGIGLFWHFLEFNGSRFYGH